MIRRFFPKKTDFKSIDLTEIKRVENEINMIKYVVEYAADAVHFIPIKEVASSNSIASKSFSILDNRSAAMEHFYRIRAVDIGGKIQYSTIARLGTSKTEPADVNLL